MMNQKLDFMHKGHIEIYKTNESKLMKHYLYMHTLIPIELLPYLQCVAITETKGYLDELVTFNYMYTIYFKYRTFLKKRFTCMLDIMSYQLTINSK
jgi:hypothetical protein